MTKFVAFILLMMSGFVHSVEPVKFLNSDANLKRGFPFSEATQVGELLFLSGQLGVDPATKKLAEGGIKPETKQLMLNISATLKRYNSSLNKVAKCTVFLADIKEWGEFNDVYRSFFKGNYPARSALGSGGLALGARVEVECIAVVSSDG